MLLISLNLFSKNVVEEPPHVAKLGNNANLRDIEDQERVLGIVNVVSVKVEKRNFYRLLNKYTVSVQKIGLTFSIFLVESLN